MSNDKIDCPECGPFPGASKPFIDSEGDEVVEACSKCEGSGKVPAPVTKVTEISQPPEGFVFWYISLGEAVFIMEGVDPDSTNLDVDADIWPHPRGTIHFKNLPHHVGQVEEWPCVKCAGSGEFIPFPATNFDLNGNPRGYQCPKCQGKGTITHECVGVEVELRTRPVTSVIYGKKFVELSRWEEKENV